MTFKTSLTYSAVWSVNAKIDLNQNRPFQLLFKILVYSLDYYTKQTKP